MPHDFPEWTSVYYHFRNNLTRILKVLCDGGYTDEKFESAVNELLGVAVVVAKRSELHKFVIIPKR